MKKRKFEGNERFYLHEVLYSGLLSSRYGNMAHRFEQAFVDKFDVPYAIAVNSGTSALFVALKACGVGPGDEVIVPCLGPTPTAAAVVHTGATPVFVDIDPKTYCMDPLKIQVSDKTIAIIPVHIFGNLCDMDSIMKIADKHGLYVIEDCAQAYDPAYDMAGDIACFSFEQTKHICCGDGGMAITVDPLLAKKMRQYSDHGLSNVPLEFDFPGYNFRMSELVAAVGLAQMETAKGGVLYKTYQFGVFENTEANEYEESLKAFGTEYSRAPWGKLVYQHEMFGAQKGLCPVAEELHPNLFIFPTR